MACRWCFIRFFCVSGSHRLEPCGSTIGWKLEHIGLNPVALVEGFVKGFGLEREALSHVCCVFQVV